MICRKDPTSSLTEELLFDSCPNCVANRHHPHKDSPKSSHTSVHRIKKSSSKEDLSMRENSNSMKATNSSMELMENKDELLWSLKEHEFYNDTSAPLDIWTKFELGQPTPPSSPERDSDSLESDLNDPSIWESILDESLDLSKLSESFEKSSDLLNTKLIQDCMWSASTDLLEPKNSKPKTDINSNSCSINRNRTDSTGDVPHSSDCVDPTSVFPYPLSEPARGGLVTASNICLDTPSPSESGN